MDPMQNLNVIEKLADYGLAGAVIALVLILGFYMYRSLAKAHIRAIKDIVSLNKTFAESSMKTASAIMKIVDRIQDGDGQIKEEIREARHEIIKAIKIHGKSN